MTDTPRPEGVGAAVIRRASVPRFDFEQVILVPVLAGYIAYGMAELIMNRFEVVKVKVANGERIVVSSRTFDLAPGKFIESSLICRTC